MKNELNLLNQLHLGDIIGDTKRMVIACTFKTNQRTIDDSFSTWVSICAKEQEHHPYVVWDVIAKPEGFSCQNGDYCYTLEEAIILYKKRGGK